MLMLPNCHITSKIQLDVYLEVNEVALSDDIADIIPMIETTKSYTMVVQEVDGIDTLCLDTEYGQSTPLE